MNYSEREAVLWGLSSVYDVVPNLGGADSRISIEMHSPDIVAIGSDWARKDYYKQMMFDQDWLDERGIALLYIPYTKGISSTAIKGRMAVD
jgi:glycerol-3-phosphate cytidylyltransferase-like family protein